MNWISVEDELPQTQDAVIVAADDVYIKRVEVITAELIDGVWILSECHLCKHAAILGDHMKITHWMPLPVPPEIK